MPGVLAVLAGADADADGLGGIKIYRLPPGFGGSKTFWPSRPVFAVDRVRHSGDGVALVVAETLVAARDAAESVEVEYEQLPANSSVAVAPNSGAPLIWEEAEGNICFAYELGDRAATDVAFARAAHVVSLRLFNQRISANPLEPRGALGSYDPLAGRYTLYSSTQAPHRTREILCKDVFGIPETSMRVVGPDVGGGFGMKGPVFPEEAMVLWASRKVGRPVKWIAERSESLLSDMHGRDQYWDAELACDKEGRMMALRVATNHNLGAYISINGHIPALLSGAILPSVYTCPLYHVSFRGMFTNTPMTGPYRGAGQPESIYVIERLLDKMAAQMSIDRVELRRRNFISAAAMPYRTPLGQNYDSGEFDLVLQKALELADWDGFENRKSDCTASGRLRGIGLASFIEITAIYNDRMEIRMDPSGAVTIVAGTFSHGQGHETTFAQMVSEWLGVPFDKIRLIQGDTDSVSFGRGT